MNKQLKGGIEVLKFGFMQTLNTSKETCFHGATIVLFLGVSL